MDGCWDCRQTSAADGCAVHSRPMTRIPQADEPRRLTRNDLPMEAADALVAFAAYLLPARMDAGGWVDDALSDGPGQPLARLLAAIGEPPDPLDRQETFDEIWEQVAALAEKRGLTLEEVTRGWSGVGYLAATLRRDNGGVDGCGHRDLDAEGDTPTAALKALRAALSPSTRPPSCPGGDECPH